MGLYLPLSSVGSGRDSSSKVRRVTVPSPTTAAVTASDIMFRINLRRVKPLSSSSISASDLTSFNSCWNLASEAA